MKIFYFLKYQISDIYKGGLFVFFKKIYKIFLILFSSPVFFIAIPIVLFIRILAPFYLIRFQGLVSSRIGHLAANTELYLCEKKVKLNQPSLPYIDIFYPRHLPICNKYLLRKWKEHINIWPRWLVHPINLINNIIPGGKNHNVGNNTKSDRDVNNLLDIIPPHFKFSEEELKKGKTNLELLGIPSNSKYVCLLVRDNAYLPDISSSYHDYRDCSIENYYLASEELTKRGYYVIRMGAKVKKNFESKNRMIIDYATNGLRTEFMDIYLGAHCVFCVSTSSGWDAIPLIFRKPIVYAPIVPLGYFFTFSDKFIGITKHHIDILNNKELSISEIFEKGLGFCLTSNCYIEKGVKLIENSQEEIRDLICEFEERLSGKWIEEKLDDNLQNRFWDLFLNNSKRHLHGEIRAKFGTIFLRNNKDWLN
jgi:putative glycosyltransferase (TIGR04372 family)